MNITTIVYNGNDQHISYWEMVSEETIRKGIQRRTVFRVIETRTFIRIEFSDGPFGKEAWMAKK